MGIIRGGTLVIVVILLFLSFLCANTLLTMFMSLDYKTVKPEIISFGSGLAEQMGVIEDVNSQFNLMQAYCQNPNRTNFVYSYQGSSFNFSCDTINAGPEALVNKTIENFAEENYYEQRDCDFWSCVTSDPLVFVSEQAYNYWKGWFYSSLLIILLLLVAVFFLIEAKIDMPLLVGGLLAISSLPFVKLGWFLSLLDSWEFFEIFQIFFTKSYTVFLISFISGIVLIGIWLVFKFLKIGHFFKKDKEESAKTSQSKKLSKK